MATMMNDRTKNVNHFAPILFRSLLPAAYHGMHAQKSNLLLCYYYYISLLCYDDILLSM